MNIEEIAGYARRNAAAAVGRLPAAGLATATIKKSGDRCKVPENTPKHLGCV